MSIPAQRAHLRLLESGVLASRMHQSVPPPDPVIDGDFRDRARQLVFDEGKNFTEAAELLRVHRQTVANICGPEGRLLPRRRRVLTS